MRKYEAVFIIRPDLEEEKTTEVIEKFKNLVEENGGEISSLEKWGKRRLAYEIKHTREGFYVVMKFSSKPSTAEELGRVFKISDEILRNMIVEDA